MRLTYKKLAKIISDKLNSVEFKHVRVEAFNPRFRSQDIEDGAATIIYKIYYSDVNYFTMFSCQWISEIEQIVNSNKFYIKIDQKNRYSLNDGHMIFLNEL